MRKILFLALVIILLAQMAEAKTILYVTSAPTDSPCSLLSTLDFPYCKRLTDLGYVVKVINELHVKDNTTTWNSYVTGSDMIFLGDVSLDMANKSKFQDSFCKNIGSRLTNRTLFATFKNTWLNKPKNIEGCAFYPSINLVNFPYNDNNCSKNTFKVAKEGFVTEGHKVGDTVDFYSVTKNIRIYDVSDGAWFTAECIINGVIDFYPVIFSSNKGVFWGLDESNFNKEGQNVFDRIIFNTIGHTSWSINPIIIPSTSTKNQNILVLAGITQLGLPVNGTVNLIIDSLTKNMSYEDDFWKYKNLNLSEEKQYNLGINAYSESILRGTAIIPYIVGGLKVDIISGNYIPNENYVITAKTYLRNTTQTVNAYYKIFNSKYSIVFIGTLNCFDNNICNATIIKMPDLGNATLEVTISVSGSVGGSFKVITEESLITTDKNVYKPGDTVQFDFFPSEEITEANITIINSVGIKEIPSAIPLEKMSPTHWKKLYTLGITIPNGTYIANVKTPKGEYNKTFDVVVWKPYAFLNQYSFYTAETLELTIGVTDVSLGTNISIDVDIVDPIQTKVFTKSGYMITGTYKTTYAIPRDYKNGTSAVIIKLKDFNNRSSTLYLNFSVNSVLQPSLLVTPTTISEITVAGKTIEKTIRIENSADIDAPLTVNVSESLKDIVKIISKPTIINAHAKADMKIRIEAGSLKDVTKTGTINFNSRVGNEKVNINLEVIGDLSVQASLKLSYVYSLEKNVTDLKKMGVNVTEVSGLLSQIKSTLSEVKISYANGNYASAKLKFAVASSKISQLEAAINSLQLEIPDNSYIIWDFAIAIVLMIVLLTVIKYRKKIKSLFKKEEPKKEEEEVIYFKPRGGHYRTEYY